MFQKFINKIQSDLASGTANSMVTKRANVFNENSKYAFNPPLIKSLELELIFNSANYKLFIHQFSQVLQVSKFIISIYHSNNGVGLFFSQIIYKCNYIIDT